MTWLHHFLQGIGQAIGQLTILGLALTLLVGPIFLVAWLCLQAAIAMGGLFAREYDAVGFISFWMFVALALKYVAPTVQPAISAAFSALVAVMKP